MTREMTRLTLSDKHRRILRGNLNIKCPHDTKVACLYISNTGIGKQQNANKLLIHTPDSEYRRPQNLS